MDAPLPDLTEARNHMVDGQVRPNKVNDPRIVQAMRRLPRERFVPPHLAGLAYIDEDVPLGGGRFLMEPMVIARLVQLARVRAGERALVVGAGTGYGAALLAACGAEVTALEDDERLLAIARRVLAETAPRVSLVAGPLAQGWAKAGPYDAVLIEGAVREIPAAVARQVRPDGGRLVTVMIQSDGVSGGVSGGALGDTSGGACVGVLAEPSGRAGQAGPVLRAQAEFDCATPPLPGLESAAPVFRF